MSDVTATGRGAPENGGRDGERAGRVYRPLADVRETGDGVTVVLEMPGVAADRVEIEVDRGVLTIRGRAGPAGPEGFQLAYAEYGEGDYERSFTLSEDLDASRIEAEARNGVVTVRLPRAEIRKPRRIAVRAV